MPSKKTLEKFIEESNIAHRNKYDYSKSVYTNNYTLITIICPSHGEFLVTARNHAHNGSGCPICGLGAMSRKIKFRKTHEQFLKDANAVHGDKYDYSQCEYITGKTKMPIICKEHGIFMQHAESHLNHPSGCPKCYDTRRIGRTGTSGYCATFFESYPEKKKLPAIIYVAKMDHEKDKFFKIGITTKLSIKERFYYKSKNGTIITPIIEQPETLYDAFLKEKHLLNNLAAFRFFPNRKFGGYTECFKINNEVISFLQSYFNINITETLER